MYLDVLGAQPRLQILSCCGGAFSPHDRLCSQLVGHKATKQSRSKQRGRAPLCRSRSDRNSSFFLRSHKKAPAEGRSAAPGLRCGNAPREGPETGGSKHGQELPEKLAGYWHRILEEDLLDIDSGKRSIVFPGGVLRSSLERCRWMTSTHGRGRGRRVTPQSRSHQRPRHSTARYSCDNPPESAGRHSPAAIAAMFEDHWYQHSAPAAPESVSGTRQELVKKQSPSRPSLVCSIAAPLQRGGEAGWLALVSGELSESP